MGEKWVSCTTFMSAININSDCFISTNVKASDHVGRLGGGGPELGDQQADSAPLVGAEAKLGFASLLELLESWNFDHYVLESQ